ncbi:MAG: PKD domain-containing protein, partial [Fibrobacterales bacterium]
AWDFGDGATGTGVTASHTYSSFGENTVTLIVTQSDGAFDTLTQNITLHDGNPDNTPDADINLALLPSSKISGSGYSRGDAGDILFDPQTNTYAQPTGWNEYGIGFGENLGLASEDTPFYWQVSWNTPQYINYITFGGTYPNQPQPNAVWKIQYSLHDSWTDIETGTGGWINSGIYEWGGSEQPPITADSMRVIVYSDGVHDLTSIHLRGRGAQSTEEDDSHTTPKATLIQYVPLTIDLPSSNEHTSSSSEAQVLSNSSTDTYSESASNTSSPISMSSFISSLHSSMYGETSELTSSDASIAPVADNSTSRHLTHLGGNLFTLHSADIKNYSLKLYDIAGNTIPFAFVYSTTIQVKIQHTGVMLYRLDSRNSKQRGMVYVY